MSDERRLFRHRRRVRRGRRPAPPAEVRPPDAPPAGSAEPAPASGEPQHADIAADQPAGSRDGDRRSAEPRRRRDTLPAAGPAEAAHGAGRVQPTPADPAAAGTDSGAAIGTSRPEPGDGTGTAGRGRGRRLEADRGLRGLVGAGPSQVGVAGAMRARDAARPRPEDLDAAERELTIVRKHYTPPA